MKNRILSQTLTVLLPFALAACQSGVIREDSLVVVKDVQIPKGMPWYSRFAKHSFIDYRESPSSPWHRLEIVNKNTGIIHEEIDDETALSRRRWDEKVRILSQSNLKDHPDALEQLRANARAYNDSVYRAWPGPNSNTFAEHLLRKTDGISAQLDHNAIGKESGFYVGPTAGGTGLELQTPVVGAAAGLKEGVEVNLIGLTAGVRIWPPAIRIPILPELPPRP